ncbi:mitochondrial 54S ribosomal protein YmL19 [Savitreella phatthalungensis]
MSKGAQVRDVLVKLVVPAGGATPSPPIGPALGARGVKSIDFCKEFNARTASYLPGVPLPVQIIVRPDRSFAFDVRTPATSWLLKKAAGIEKGAGAAGTTAGGGGGGGKKGGAASGQAAISVSGTVSVKHIFEIAKVKQADPRLAHLSLEAVARSVVGTAKTLGLKVQA